MGCLDADTVLAWIDGQLSSQRSTEVEVHIDGCAACRRVMSEAAATADDTAAPGEALPERLGPYEIRGLIGRGGMGEVYRAYDPRLDREVAVKVIHPQGRRLLRADDLDWFERETRAAAAISHANVLAVFDVGRHEGVPYVVTELLEGESLRKRLARGPIGPRQAVAWARDLAQGMAAAHDRGIVHRDIKPDNVFVTGDGRVKILDFGVATFLRGRGDDDDLEEPGLVVGTLGYMAPEQLRGDKVDHRTDVFAFGAVMYEMLTGEAAFRGGGELEIAESALGEDPIERSPDTLTKVPWPIVQVVRRCLEKSPEARFQSARDLAFALDMLGSDTTRASATTRRARRWPWLVGGVAIAAAAAVTLASVWPGKRPPAAPLVVSKLLHRSAQVFTARRGSGATVYASAAFGDGVGIDGIKAMSIVRLERDGTPLPIPNTQGMLVLAVRGDTLLVLRDVVFQVDRLRGKLALIDLTGRQLPIAGADGKPLEADQLADILVAEFLPDGTIAVVRESGGRAQVEAPIGTIVFGPTTSVLSMRVSKSGTIALIEGVNVDGKVATTVKTIPLGGRPTLVPGAWRDATSVAWYGDELLVSGTRDGGGYAVWNAGQGGTRALWSTARALVLQDTTPNGGLIIDEFAIERRVFAHEPSWKRDRDLSRSDQSTLADLSLDGKWISFIDGIGTGAVPTIFVRSLDGGEPIQIGRGLGGVLDRTGHRVLARTPQAPWRLVETTLPTRPGEPVRSRELDPGNVENIYAAGWLDDARIAVLGIHESSLALYVHPVDGKPVRQGPWHTTQHIARFRVSPDGTRIADADADNYPAVIEIDTLAVTRIPDHPNDTPVGWSAASDAVWLANLYSWPIVVTRYSKQTGASVAFEIPAPEPGVLPALELRIAGDGKTYAYSVIAFHSELLVVGGALGEPR